MRFLIAAFLICMLVVQADAKHRRRHHRHVEQAPVVTLFSGSSVADYMRRYVGTNPTGWARVWCGRFLDMALRATGHPPGSNLARAYAHYGTPASGPCVGCLGVWAHHVGVVTAVGNGTVTMISGNDGRRVRERIRSVRGAIAWRRI